MEFNFEITVEMVKQLKRQDNSVHQFNCINMSIYYKLH